MDDDDPDNDNIKPRANHDFDNDDLGISQEEGEDALEDDTDYAVNYFDNGEDYVAAGGDDDYEGEYLVFIIFVFN